MLASRSFLVEKPVRATGNRYSEGPRHWHELRTYVLQVRGDEAVRAVVPWEVQDGEYTSPLLAHWRYGLGRSVAFSSDAKAKWAKDWVGTEPFTQTWTQVARWLIGRQWANR